MFLGFREARVETDVFDRLYRENRLKLYYMALKVLHNEADAEDAVHMGFVKLAEHFEDYKGQSFENLSRLLSTIVKNTAMDIARDYVWRASFFEEPGFGEENVPMTEGEVVDLLIEKYERERLNQMLCELSDFERRLLYMRYAMCMKPKEIGEVFGLSSAIVRKRILRTKQRLEKLLQEE